LTWPADNRITVKYSVSGSGYYLEPIASVTLLGSDQKLRWNRDDKG
jgi:hypothetical protein